jgi:hypothetical protein
MVYSTIFLSIFSVLVFILAHKLRLKNVSHSPVLIGKFHPSPNSEGDTAHSSAFPVWAIIIAMCLSLTILWWLSQNVTNIFFWIISVVNVLISVLLFFRLRGILFPTAESGVSTIVTLGLGILLGLSWHINQGWLIYGLLAASTGTFLLSQYTLANARYLVLLFVGIIAYDIWGVFGTEMIVDVVSVGLRTAENRWLPAGALVVVPIDLLQLWTPVSKNVRGILGTGDIFFSGLAVMYAYRHNLQWWVMTGYVVGLILSTIAVSIYQVPMPAMLFLAPATLLFLFTGSYLTKRKLEW